jgi:hypothetical protein
MNTLQKFSVVASTALLALGVSAGSASAASLIGQTIKVDYLFPNVNSIVDSKVTTVTADSSDTVIFSSGVNFDPNAQGFSITNLLASGFSSATFNGIKTSNLNFGDGSFITGVFIDSKTGIFTPFDPSRISFTNDSVSLNFESLPFTTGSDLGNLRIGLQTSSRPVPVPGAVFGVVIAGGALVARQRKNAKSKQTVA